MGSDPSISKAKPERDTWLSQFHLHTNVSGSSRSGNRSAVFVKLIRYMREPFNGHRTAARNNPRPPLHFKGEENVDVRQPQPFRRDHPAGAFAQQGDPPAEQPAGACPEGYRLAGLAAERPAGSPASAAAG